MTAVICCLCFASSASAADASAAVEYYKGTGIAVLKKAGQNSEIPKNTTGWMRDQTDWYYATGNGACLSDGWFEINSKWYCFDQRGYIRTGWIKSGKNWYYCDASETDLRGSMLTGQITPDGYYVNENGVWIP